MPDHVSSTCGVRFERGNTRLRINIPLASSEAARLHLTALLAIWALGAAFATVSLFLERPILGPTIVHVFWLLAGVPVLWVYIRYARGREVITVSDNKLTIERRPLGLGFQTRYLLSRAKRFRVDTDGLRMTDWRHRMNPLRWRGARGLILFDYDLQPVRFGAGLDVPSAREILIRLQESGYVSPERVEL